MKLVLTLLLFPFIAICQDIPKNANTLIIHNVSFSQVMNALLDSGYKIDKSDKEFGTIKTEYKKLCVNCVPDIYFDVRVKDSTATFSGGWRSSGDIFSFGATSSNEHYLLFPIQNEKSKVPRTCFAKLNDFVKSFGQSITYAKN